MKGARLYKVFIFKRRATYYKNFLFGEEKCGGQIRGLQ